VIDTIACGDAFDLIEYLPKNSINSIITSPPFWKQRTKDIPGYVGDERSLEGYTDRLVSLFDKAATPLKPDGTLWLNLGEKFKDKRMTMMPFKVALALEQAGWIPKDTIIWDKMDKCFRGDKGRTTLCHEYIFVFSRTPDPYYDQESLIEDGVIPAGTRGAKGSKERHAIKGVNARPPVYWTYSGKRNKRSVWHVKPRPSKYNHYSQYPIELVEPCVLASCPLNGVVLDPFGGMATTALAARKNGRHFICFELDSGDVDKARERLRIANGKSRDRYT
jgi:DNA modification methylase